MQLIRVTLILQYDIIDDNIATLRRKRSNFERKKTENKSKPIVFNKNFENVGNCKL